MNPTVESFRDPTTGTFSHIVFAQDGGEAAIIDPLLDFDPASATTATESADRLLAFVAAHALRVVWILETHAHADHLSAASYLRERTGARLGIGEGIVEVQKHWCEVFALEHDFVADGRQFDHLFVDGERFFIGELEVRVMATPGHTSDGLTYLIGDAAFVGDTLFAPDLGSARCDFPGGDAARLYGSIQRILALPGQTRLFLCHDYPPEGREAQPFVRVAQQRERNIHVGQDAALEAFVHMRRTRDAGLPQPRLILPSLQVNIRGGRLPPADADGKVFLKLPLNQTELR